MNKQGSLSTTIVKLTALISGIEELVMPKPQYKQTIFCDEKVSHKFKRKCFVRPFMCPLNDLVETYVNRVNMIEFEKVSVRSKWKRKVVDSIKKRIENKLANKH